MKMRKIIAVLAAALMLFSILPMAVFAADTYELASSIAVGDTVVLACTSKSMELNGISTTSTKYGVGVAYTGAPVGAYALTVEEGYTAGTYSFKCPNNQYLYWTSGNSLATNASKSANTSWTVVFSGDNAIIKNAKDTARQLQWNASNPRFACYGNSGQTAVQLFKLVTGGTDEPECEHVWVEADCDTPKTCSVCGDTEGEALGHSYVEDIIDATCTATGTATYECSVCGHSYDEEIPMIPHDYVDGFCSVCNEPQPLEATITFDDLSKMTSSSTTQQVWEENSIVVTYDKNTYNNNLAEYANPVRFYAGTKVTIAYPGITKVVIVANTSAYAVVVKGGLPNSTVSGSTVTYECAAVDSVSFVPTAQARVNSITVYGSAPSDCDHNYVGVETQAPTCTVEGLMTYTCSECGDEYTAAIAVAPHDYVEDIIPATCTTTGTKTYTCSVCSDSYDEVIPMAPHNYVDDVCADCGHVKVYKGTLVFDADKENRTEYSTQIQVWESEGVKLTNNKGESTTNVGDYGDPGRFYKNSTIIIEFPEMSKLIINADDSNNGAYAWDATLDAAGLTYTAADGVYTITFAEPTNSITLKTSNQVRAYNITAIVDHECVYDDNFDTDCNKCGEIRDVELPISHGGFSIKEDKDGIGLAAKFDIVVSGMDIAEGKKTQADYTNATVNGYELISMGAIVTNGVSTKNVPAVYLCDLDDASASYAIRIIDIPADKQDVKITFTPYFTIKIDGEQVTVEGVPVARSYNG